MLQFLWYVFIVLFVFVLCVWRWTARRVHPAVTSLTVYRRPYVKIKMKMKMQSKTTMSMSHIHATRGTRARSERPLAGPEKNTQMFGDYISQQDFLFLRSSKVCFLHQNLKFSVPLVNIWHRNWYGLSEIHWTDPKIWPKRRHHVADFLFDENVASTPFPPADRKIASTIPRYNAKNSFYN